MDSYEIRLSGTGGQGSILAGLILSNAVLREGKWVAQSQSFEPLSRGGVSRADVVVCTRMVDYPLVSSLDFLLVLDQPAVNGSEGVLKPTCAVLLDSDRVETDAFEAFRPIALPLEETSRALGHLRVTNMVALGALVALTNVCRPESLQAAIRQHSPEGFERINHDAMETGYRLGHDARHSAPSP